MTAKKIDIEDLINIGMFTAVIAVITLLIAPIGFIPYLMPLYCVFIPLLSGIPFMLFMTRVRKYGMITIMSILLAVFLFLTGMGLYTLPLVLVTGPLADLMARLGRYRSIRISVAACGVFSLWCFGSFIPLIFMPDAFWAQNQEFGAEYISAARGVFQIWMAPALMLSCLIFGTAGGMAGSRILKKHFLKSGML
jgi:energy-coupling factor transport system substrate-specific component